MVCTREVTVKEERNARNRAVFSGSIECSAIHAQIGFVLVGKESLLLCSPVSGLLEGMLRIKRTPSLHDIIPEVRTRCFVLP